MNGLVLGLAAAVVALRLWWKWGHRSGGPWRGLRPGLPVAAGESETLLVAAREVHERVRARSFRVVTALLLLAVGAAIVLPVATRGGARPQRVGVVGSFSSSQRAAVLSAASSVGTRADIRSEPDRAAADAALRAGTIDLAVIDGRQVLVHRGTVSTDTTATARMAYAVAAGVGVLRAFAAAGVSEAQMREITAAKALPVTGLEPATSRSTPVTGTALVGVIIIFVMLSQYETWTLIGVMEEKSSRVVEVLLAAVRPIQLLGGKVLGIGVVAMAQAGALLAFALVLAGAVGSDVLRGSGPLVLAAALLWLVVGYAFYCWVYAAAGSLAERQDQVQMLALPLTLPMLLGYIMAVVTASSGHASALSLVLGYLPPTAPFAMPVLVGLGAVSWWGFVGSVVISLACTVAVARLAAAVYRRAVLHTGHRVGLRELLAG